MKKSILIVIFLFVGRNFIKAQDISCTTLMEYVIKNGYIKANVNSLQLINSSWLKDVTAYSVDNKIVVIAEIKTDNTGIFTKKYIFCGITSSTWDSFYYGLSDFGKSYGERFQKYIIDNVCNCY